MTKALLSALITTVLPCLIYAQLYSIKGKITNKETGLAIAGASVFLSNTSYGTVSNNNGYFELKNIRQGKYDIIASFIGFETYNNSLTLNASIDNLNIQIKEKPKELEGVVVRQYLKNGWEQWGTFFIQSFIGTSALGLQCKLKNPEVLKFSHMKKDGLLYVDAMEPLLVENKALGYEIRYQMESFVYNFNTKALFYAGYPLFIEMEGNKSKQNKWEKARAYAYEFSCLRFLRSVFRNRLVEDGYEIYRMDRIPNVEKQQWLARERQYYDTVSKKLTIKNFSATLPADSLPYYEKIMRQKDPVEIIHPGKVTGDDIAYGADSFTAALDFQQCLIVRIPKLMNPQEYVETYRDASRSQPVTSVVILPNHTPILITSNGYFYEPEDLMLEGFWGWWEKMSAMLPFDYWPAKE